MVFDGYQKHEETLCRKRQQWTDVQVACKKKRRKMLVDKFRRQNHYEHYDSDDYILDMESDEDDWEVVQDLDEQTEAFFEFSDLNNYVLRFVDSVAHPEKPKTYLLDPYLDNKLEVTDLCSRNWTYPISREAENGMKRLCKNFEIYISRKAAVARIERAFKKAYCDPKHDFCKRRLLGEFESLEGPEEEER